MTRHLCPSHDTYFDTQVDRMFFTRENGLRLDAMREQIETWDEAQLISPRNVPIKRFSKFVPCVMNCTSVANYHVL